MLPNLWQQIHSGLKGSCLWLHLPPGWSSKRSSKDSEHPLHSIGKCYYFTYRLNSYNWFPASHRAHDLLFIIRVFLRHKLDRRTSVPAPSDPQSSPNSVAALADLHQSLCVPRSLDNRYTKNFLTVHRTHHVLSYFTYLKEHPLWPSGSIYSFFKAHVNTSLWL